MELPIFNVLRPRAAVGISPPLLVNYEGIRFPAFCNGWKFVFSNVILVKCLGSAILNQNR